VNFILAVIYCQYGYDIKGINICTSTPIINVFVEYYNNQRMHQGINKIPDAEIMEKSGVIKK